MDNQNLIEQAEQIQAISSETAEKFYNSSPKMIVDLNIKMLVRPDLERLIGKDNKDMMVQNHQNQFRFMQSVMTMYKANVFVETLTWVFHTYRSHGFTEAYWPAMLNTLFGVMEAHLDEAAYKEVYPFYHFILINQPAINQLAFSDD